jgi:hypothetical protein
MQFDQVISFDKKKFFLFFMIFLFLFKTKNSYFDNKQLKVINANQINSNATSFKINETQNSLKLFNNYLIFAIN